MKQFDTLVFRCLYYLDNEVVRSFTLCCGSSLEQVAPSLIKTGYDPNKRVISDNIASAHRFCCAQLLLGLHRSTAAVAADHGLVDSTPLLWGATADDGC